LLYINCEELPMKRLITLSLLAALAATSAAAQTAEATKARVERGAYMVRTMGCNDCHTPLKMGANGPEPDMSRALTGHPQDMVMPPAPKLPPGPWVWVGAATNTAFAGPWGTSFAMNLTPDMETGIGKWTEKQFIDTMRTGRHLGIGRPILPPMPYFIIGAATDEDIKSLFAYLRTLTPVKNKVPQPIEPPAAN
jgi:hypothetical protein